jgi:potassium-transporting ATPase KdpC subunit
VNPVYSFDALRRHLAALRLIVALTVLTGIVYPLAIAVVGRLPGLRYHADGSLVRVGSRVVGSSLLGQGFVDASGVAIPKYFQARPSAAGAGYDPTSSGGSNLGPEDVIDALPDPGNPTDSGKQSLLSQVCTRSMAVGQLEGVDGRRPYCTANGLGAVLSIVYERGMSGPIRDVVSVNQECPAKPFIATYDGVAVSCAKYGVDYRVGRLVLVRGPGKGADNPVPADAVTASASGLDPDISVAYADVQAPRVARARGLSNNAVLALIKTYTVGRGLGFMGDPVVDVVQLNLALDRQQRAVAR